jgi:hypothetical protein
VLLKTTKKSNGRKRFPLGNERKVIRKRNVRPKEKGM